MMEFEFIPLGPIKPPGLLLTEHSDALFCRRVHTKETS